MKKRLVAVLVMLVVMIAGCGNSNGAEEPNGVDSQMTESETDIDVPSFLDRVTMEVTEYFDTSVTVRIINDTDMNIRCGEDFCLKILDEETGEWRDLDTVIDDYGFFEEAYMIQKDSPYETVIDFEWLYGKLEPGRYQIVNSIVPTWKNDVIKTEEKIKYGITLWAVVPLYAFNIAYPLCVCKYEILLQKLNTNDPKSRKHYCLKNPNHSG